MKPRGMRPQHWLWMARWWGWGADGRSHACLCYALIFPILVMIMMSSGSERSPGPQGVTALILRAQGHLKTLQRASSFLVSPLHLCLFLSSIPNRNPKHPQSKILAAGVSQPVPYSEAWVLVSPPVPEAPLPSPASVSLTQTGNRDFPMLRALHGRQPWGLL